MSSNHSSKGKVMFKKISCVVLALALSFGPHSVADACNLLSGICARVAARQQARAEAYGNYSVRYSYGSSGSTSYGSSGATSYGSSGGVSSYGSSGGVTYSAPVVVYEEVVEDSAPVVYEQKVRRTPVRNTLQKVFSPKTSRCANGKCSSTDLPKASDSVAGVLAPVVVDQCPCGEDCKCIDCDCPKVSGSVAGTVAPVVDSYSVAGKKAPIVTNPILVASL
jgi:hypothetical protein